VRGKLAERKEFASFIQAGHKHSWRAFCDTYLAYKNRQIGPLVTEGRTSKCNFLRAAGATIGAASFAIA